MIWTFILSHNFLKYNRFMYCKVLIIKHLFIDKNVKKNRNRPLENATTNARRLAGADVNNINALPYENLCLTKEFSVEPIKCKQCEVIYCSEICRNDAYNQYHMVMCLKNNYNDPLHPMNELKEIWKYE